MSEGAAHVDRPAPLVDRRPRRRRAFARTATSGRPPARAFRGSARPEREIAGRCPAAADPAAADAAPRLRSTHPEPAARGRRQDRRASLHTPAGFRPFAPQTNSLGRGRPVLLCGNRALLGVRERATATAPGTGTGGATA